MSLDESEEGTSDPYEDGERNKKSDIRSGILMSAGQMFILTLLFILSMFFGGFFFVGIIYIGIFIGLSISFFKNPNIDGKRKKVVDFLLGIILMIGEGLSIDLLYQVQKFNDVFTIIILFFIIDTILIFLFLKKNRIYLVIGIAIGMYGFAISLEFIPFVLFGPCVYFGAFLYYLYLRYKKKKDISSIRPS